VPDSRGGSWIYYLKQGFFLLRALFDGNGYRDGRSDHLVVARLRFFVSSLREAIFENICPGLSE
jgi:hypothetical protein